MSELGYLLRTHFKLIFIIWSKKSIFKTFEILALILYKYTHTHFRLFNVLLHYFKNKLVSTVTGILKTFYSFRMAIKMTWSFSLVFCKCHTLISLQVQIEKVLSGHYTLFLRHLKMKGKQCLSRGHSFCSLQE